MMQQQHVTVTVLHSAPIHTQPGPNPHGLGLAWKRGSVELGERFIGSIYSSGTA